MTPLPQNNILIQTKIQSFTIHWVHCSNRLYKWIIHPFFIPTKRDSQKRMTKKGLIYTFDSLSIAWHILFKGWSVQKWSFNWSKKRGGFFLDIKPTPLFFKPIKFMRNRTLFKLVNQSDTPDSQGGLYKKIRQIKLKKNGRYVDQEIRMLKAALLSCWWQPVKRAWLWYWTWWNTC